ncbi:hypothetical protein FTO70_05690 [Methanosarcina sp. KYL-1]|nr:hypothetical protein [Methanosarcina sp. KYL-1]
MIIFSKISFSNCSKFRKHSFSALIRELDSMEYKGAADTLESFQYDIMVRREVMLWIAEQPAILSIQNVPILMCISGNGSVQSSEDNEV